MARLFAFIGRDGPNGPEGRKHHREKHLENLAELRGADRIAHAGPLLDSEGHPIGSLILFEARDLEEAEQRAASDPYVTEGIFASYDVFETRAVFGDRAPREEA